MIRKALFAVLVLGAPRVEAAVKIVATTSSMELLAHVVGGDAVRITTLSPPDRDAHHLLAKPSMMVALRNADLVLAVGGELEVGWLPAALQGAANPRILPGQAGYFEGSAQIDLIEKGGSADRSRGDVHPMGNPHFYMDPERMARVAKALAGRLGSLDSSHAAIFAANAEAFTKAVAERIPGWKSRAAGAPGIVFYHKDGDYLANLLEVPILGFVEPLPGIPPTASHLKGLVEKLKGQHGVILYNTYHSGDGPQFLARELGWKAFQLQLEVDTGADAKAYLDHIDRWVTAAASARQ